MKNAVVVGGLGAVGRATRAMFGIDKYIDLHENNISLEEASSLRYHFICVPTPVVNGDYQTETITNYIKSIVAFGKQNVFVIRSTVYPGFNRHARDICNTDSIVYNPEFFTESDWEQDIKMPDLVVVGCDQKNYKDDVVGIYKSRYKGVDIVEADAITAEFIKLSINAFYTTKVVFANQIYDYATSAGANYEIIKRAMYQRKWIGRNHLDVFHKGGRGAGGKCLRKDTEAFSNKSGLELLQTVLKLNKHYLTLSNKSHA